MEILRKSVLQEHRRLGMAGNAVIFILIKNYQIFENKYSVHKITLLKSTKKRIS